MKVKGLILLILFLTSIKVLAEYHSYQIEFNIELKDGSKIHAYSDIPPGYIKNNETPVEKYLEEHSKSLLQNPIISTDGEAKYFANRYAYNYDCGNGKTCRILKVLDPKTIDFNRVNSIDVIEIISQSYISSITSKHTIEDQEWMNSGPVELHVFGGLLCAFQIFIHEKTDKTDAIIKTLETHSKSVNEKALHCKSRKETEELYEKADEDISNIISRFSEDESHKVVVITQCTC